jgi:rod shape-determining protein MreC
MESFFSRYRNLLVLLALLVAQVIGLAVQVRRVDSGQTSLDPKDSSGVRLIRLWANALVSPPARVIHASKIDFGAVWRDYIALRHVREENAELQKTIDRLRLEQAELLEDAHQGQRLQGLMNFQEKYIYKAVAAQAIMSSGSDHSRVFYLDKGSADGLDRDMAVITPDGIVGKVREVFPHSAQVLAINDPTSGAGVILETTRIRGILRGNLSGRTQIVGILADQRIQPGEKVLTAGGDQVFPRGLPVGVVENVVRDPDRDAFIQVNVKPAAQLERLDEVLVITSTQPRFSPEGEQDLATSAALKGPEAAAIKEQQVKEQQKASATMAEHLPGLLDPKLPPEQQPLNDSSNPNMVARPPMPLHPDRFTPGASPVAAEPEANGEGTGEPGTTAATAKAKKAATPAKAPPTAGGPGKPAPAIAPKPQNAAPKPKQESGPQGNQ